MKEDAGFSAAKLTNGPILRLPSELLPPATTNVLRDTFTNVEKLRLNSLSRLSKFAIPRHDRCMFLGISSLQPMSSSVLIQLDNLYSSLTKDPSIIIDRRGRTNDTSNFCLKAAHLHPTDAVVPCPTPTHTFTLSCFSLPQVPLPAHPALPTLLPLTDAQVPTTFPAADPAGFMPATIVPHVLQHLLFLDLFPGSWVLSIPCVVSSSPGPPLSVYPTRVILSPAVLPVDSSATLSSRFSL